MIKRLSTILAGAVFSIALVACSMINGGSITDKDQSAFFKAETGYTAAIIVISDYTGLPRCGDNAPTVCSSQTVVDQLRMAANSADVTIQYAEDLIRNHPELDASFAMDAALKAMNALDSVMATYHVGPVSS